MCGIGYELAYYTQSALLILSSTGFVIASFYYKNDLGKIFKKEDKIVI